MRITQSMRDSILEKELRAKFDEKLSKAETAVVQEVEKEVVKMIPKNIPQDMINERYIRVSNDAKIYIEGKNKYEYIDCHNSYPIQWTSSYHEVKMTKAIEKAMKARDELKEDKEKFRQKLKYVLNSFTTHKSLILNVPEFSQYFANEETAKSMAVVPVEQIKELRKALAR
jgi:chemotaxis regulatin CheY-phosphate phosphatase CheZ